MSIKAYCGRMGSGKTYEVVTSVIMPALGRGRRVVTNIAGIDYDEIVGILVEQGCSPDKIGTMVNVGHDAVMLPEFWRTDKDAEQGVDSFIQPGDLVALDEIWRFWEGFAGRKMPERVMNFYRMHRHFTHPETGVSCDVAIITQDPLDIARKVRAVIEETYVMEKLTAIGSTKRYRVDIFQGARTSRRPLRQLQREYDPRYFGTYSSHSQKKEGDADAVEENIDQRGNILRGALFRVVLPLGVLVFGAAAYFIYGFFHPTPKDKPATEASSKAGAKQPGAAGQGDAVSHAKAAPDESEIWRAVGFTFSARGMTVVLTDGYATRLLVNPPNFRINSVGVESVLPGGEIVAAWTGRKPDELSPAQ